MNIPWDVWNEATQNFDFTQIESIYKFALISRNKEHLDAMNNKNFLLKLAFDANLRMPLNQLISFSHIANVIRNSFNAQFLICMRRNPNNFKTVVTEVVPNIKNMVELHLYSNNKTPDSIIPIPLDMYFTHHKKVMGSGEVHYHHLMKTARAISDIRYCKEYRGHKYGIPWVIGGEIAKNHFNHNGSATLKINDNWINFWDALILTRKEAAKEERIDVIHMCNDLLDYYGHREKSNISSLKNILHVNHKHSLDAALPVIRNCLRLSKSIDEDDDNVYYDEDDEGDDVDNDEENEEDVSSDDYLNEYVEIYNLIGHELDELRCWIEVAVYYLEPLSKDILKKILRRKLYANWVDVAVKLDDRLSHLRSCFPQLPYGRHHFHRDRLLAEMATIPDEYRKYTRKVGAEYYGKSLSPGYVGVEDAIRNGNYEYVELVLQNNPKYEVDSEIYEAKCYEYDEQIFFPTFTSITSAMVVFKYSEPHIGHYYNQYTEYGTYALLAIILYRQSNGIDYSQEYSNMCDILDRNENPNLLVSDRVAIMELIGAPPNQ